MHLQQFCLVYSPWTNEKTVYADVTEQPTSNQEKTVTINNQATVVKQAQTNRQQTTDNNESVTQDNKK